MAQHQGGRWEDEAAMLVDMGFADPEANVRALQQNDGNVQAALDELLAMALAEPTAASPRGGGGGGGGGGSGCSSGGVGVGGSGGGSGDDGDGGPPPPAPPPAALLRQTSAEVIDFFAARGRTEGEVPHHHWFSKNAHAY